MPIRSRRSTRRYGPRLVPICARRRSRRDSLQAEIREDYAKVEPFERNLIVADRGADVTYIEGCTAPVYTPDQLHVSAIEVIAMPGSRRAVHRTPELRPSGGQPRHETRARPTKARASNGSTELGLPAGLEDSAGGSPRSPAPRRNSSELPSRERVNTKTSARDGPPAPRTRSMIINARHRPGRGTDDLAFGGAGGTGSHRR